MATPRRGSRFALLALAASVDASQPPSWDKVMPPSWDKVPAYASQPPSWDKVPAYSSFHASWPSASGKVKLKIDPERYRSSSQGPLTYEEATTRGRPLNVDDLQEIDEVIDRVTRTFGWSPVIPQYSGGRHWAWHQWSGTIFERLWRHAALAVGMPAALILGISWFDPSVRWLGTPDGGSPLIAPLLAVASGWSHLLTLTTFVVTFFVGHSHTFWRKSYALTRVVQGRLNDIGLLCATHVARQPSGELTPEARQFLKDMARELWLMHMLFWSDVCYRRSEQFGASIRVLLSVPALDRLLERGLLNEREHATLLAADLPPSRWYLVVLEWLTSRLVAARREGTLLGGEAFDMTALNKVCELRSACMGIPDELAARMPLAYVHFTHLLVDALLYLAPFALCSKLGAFSVLLNPIIALFYRGLLELSKSFLDPFGNRRVSASGLSADISIATLIGEANAGSIVWPQGAALMPFDVGQYRVDASAAVQRTDAMPAGASR